MYLDLTVLGCGFFEPTEESYKVLRFLGGADRFWGLVRIGDFYQRAPAKLKGIFFAWHEYPDRFWQLWRFHRTWCHLGYFIESKVSRNPWWQRPPSVISQGWWFGSHWGVWLFHLCGFLDGTWVWFLWWSLVIDHRMSLMSLITAEMRILQGNQSQISGTYTNTFSHLFTEILTTTPLWANRRTHNPIVTYMIPPYQYSSPTQWCQQSERNSMCAYVPGSVICISLCAFERRL